MKKTPAQKAIERARAVGVLPPCNQNLLYRVIRELFRAGMPK